MIRGNLTLSDFARMEVVEDDNLNGRARVVYGYNHSGKLCLPGFSADPNLKDYEIREQAFHYYKQLIQVLYGKRKE